MTLRQFGILIACLLGCVSTLPAQQSSSTATATTAVKPQELAGKSSAAPTDAGGVADSKPPAEVPTTSALAEPAPAPPPGLVNFIPIWTSAINQADSVIFQQPGTTNIGVNTISPAGPIDVLGLSAGPHSFRFGSARESDSNGIVVHNNNNARFTTAFIQGSPFRFPFGSSFVPGASQGDGGLAVAPGSRILFGDAKDQRMVLSAQGHVGIGVNAPASPLDVRGTGQGLTGILSVTQLNNAFGTGISVNAGGGGDGINVTNTVNGIVSTGRILGLMSTGGANGAGVFALNPSSPGFGLVAQVGGPSNCCTLGSTVAVWGDSSTGGGVIGTAANHQAIMGLNLGPATTAVFMNGTSTPTGLVFGTLGFAFSKGCLIDVLGNLTCSGNKSAAVSVDNNSRQVALNAIEAPENWFEDFGTGKLSGGSTTIKLDPTFVQTVNTEKEYHVFLTPRGDCEGLYVAKTGPSTFEVKELRHGTSDVKFDYRIVALRKGFEEHRLDDMTETFNRFKESAARIGGPITKIATPAPPASAEPEPAPKGDEQKP